MYQTIRTAAYEPDPAHGPWRERLQVLRLGDELLAELSRRTGRAYGGADFPVRLPTRRLNALLRAMAPGVVATGRNAGTDGRLPWLYARDAVPREVLAPLIGTWASGLVPGGEEPADSDIEAELLAEDAGTVRLPSWEAEDINLAGTVKSSGGTAEPDRQLYSLLPEWLAFRLVSQPFHSRGATLRFRVASSENGAALVSWPPLRYERRNGTWYYSAYVNITVHTVPFRPRFRVHVSTGIRRWVTRFGVRPGELSGTTVLLDVPLPWPSGPDESYRLTENTLGYDRRRKELAWRRHSPGSLLPELDIVRRYPEPAELFAFPETWLNGRGDVAAGIVYHPSIGPHEVEPGLMPRERAELDAWVENGLRPMLRRVEDLTRVTRRNTPSLLSRSAKDPDTREVRRTILRREALACALNGQPLEAEILWQSPETRDALLTELPRLLGLPPGHGPDPNGGVWQWRSYGLEINVRVRAAGPIAGALRFPGNPNRSRAARLAEAIADRHALVAEAMGPPRRGIGVVIAEIAGKDHFAKTPDLDPKHALRVAWAHQGWLSQFLNLPGDAEGTLEHRARWTWLDAFRQLGAISPPAHRVGSGIPGDLQYAALWLVRYTKKGPTRCPARRLIAVRVRPGDGPSVIEGWDGARAEWVPYSHMLLSLAETSELSEKRLAPDQGGKEQQWQQEAERQIRSLLFQLRERPTLLLIAAGNLRQCWPRLRNGALARDMLGFGTGPDQRHTVYGDDLRVVLVRDANGRDEVAEWYAHDAEGKVGFSEGVWGAVDPENRVFASTASTPHTAARLPKGLMKLVPAADGRTAPGKPAWNPVQLELTILGCLSAKALAESGRDDVPPDQPAEWATLAHQLRYHDDYPPLSRPLPLHLARLAGQYVLPIPNTD